MPEKAKVIFFGTSPFGLKALDWLFNNTELLAVVTTPDKPAGRKLELKSSPVKDWALENNLNLLQPEKLKEEGFIDALKMFEADVAVLASYGKMVPQEVLDVFPKGIVNIHPSMLPKFRGATPVQSAILLGEKNTGVSLMLIDKDLDHGPIIAQSEFPISNDDTNTTLHDKLAAESVKLLNDNFYMYLSGEITPIEQDHTKATFTKLLTKEDGKIDWSKPAEETERQVRALIPWRTWSDSSVGVINIFKVKISDGVLPAGKTEISDNQIVVGTSAKALEILELQLPGGKRISAPEFLRGFRGTLEFK